MGVRYYLIIWLSTGFLFGPMSHCGHAERVIRLTNGEWAPYFSEKLPHYGIGSRIVTEAFALEGITVKYKFFPWKRGLWHAKDGTYDGAVGWQTNSERERYFYASETVWQAPWVFFHLKATPFTWQTFGDLSAYRVGGTLGYMYTIDLLKAERSKKFTMERTPTDEQNFKKLVAGRIDVFPQLLDVGYHQVNMLFDGSTVKLITHHPNSFGIHAEQLLLSRKHERNARMLKIFNRGLHELKDSGKYNRYLEELRDASHAK